MDKKISIRLKEKEYEEISQKAKKVDKSISEYIRKRALIETELKDIKGADEIKRQLMIIKKNLSKLSCLYPNMDSKSIEDAMEVIWNELY